ncbi:MAG: response regulator [Gammaproteobacteria bacterium]|nr:response regulator [Gammaproteobacteria bacterium]
MNASTSADLQRILAVEDEEDIARILELSLGQIGKLDVTLCRNGPDALAVAEEARPQLLLLDFMMPGMDGLTLMRELRKLPSTAETPVIFLTAKSQPNEVQEYLDAGAAAVIQKPFDPMGLADEIRSIWQELQAAG